MTTLEAGITARLEAIGTPAGNRIYPRRLPQEATLPAVVYQLIDEPRAYTLNPGEAPYARAKYQLTCWADDYLEALDLAEAVVAGLGGWRGVLTSGHRIDSVKVANEMDLYDPDRDLDRRIVDTVWAFQPAA